jgi:hypothetical protein
MTETRRNEAVEALAREMIGRVSPVELPLLHPTALRYFADPQGTLTARKSSDEALGFGVETAAVLLSPFALELAKSVLTRLLEGIGDAAADGLAHRVLRWLKPDAGERSSQGPEPLDAAQLALVRQTANEEAHRLALPPEQSTRLADALVASLATRA